jgi:hypothetical protein
MFGYINVQKNTLTKGQYGLWHTFLCGLCMSLKDMYGNKARLTANFDVNFLNVLLHSFTETEAQIKMDFCATSPLKKRSIMQRDFITDRIATANILLMRLNAEDDVKDELSLTKRIAVWALKKPYSAAKAIAGELDEKIRSLYRQLLTAEQQDEGNIDKVCHYSAQILAEVVIYVLEGKANDEIISLCYNVGKWIYLIDALDDLKKDFKKHNYNALIAWLGSFSDAKSFVAVNRENLEFLFFATLNKIAENFNNLNLNAYSCVLKNIIYSEMRQKTLKIMDDYTGSNKNDDRTSLSNTAN